MGAPALLQRVPDDLAGPHQKAVEEGGGGFENPRLVGEATAAGGASAVDTREACPDLINRTKSILGTRAEPETVEQARARADELKRSGVRYPTAT